VLIAVNFHFVISAEQEPLTLVYILDQDNYSKDHKTAYIKIFKRKNITELFIPAVLSSFHYLLSSLIIVNSRLEEIRLAIHFRQLD
jgi:hypothetical protein